MKRRQFALAAAALPGLLALPSAHAQSKGYLTLERTAPVDAPAGKIEVIEFFSYSCPHCMHFEPIFENWRKGVARDVTVHQVHVGFNKGFEPLQRIYYALEAMGQLGAMQAKVFDAMQNQRKRLDKSDVLMPWIAEQGLDRAKFEETYKSFGVDSKLRRAVQLQEAYQVQATPSMGIAGRFYTDPDTAPGGGFDAMLKVVDDLIVLARKDK